MTTYYPMSPQATAPMDASPSLAEASDIPHQPSPALSPIEMTRYESFMSRQKDLEREVGLLRVENDNAKQANYDLTSQIHSIRKAGIAEKIRMIVFSALVGVLVSAAVFLVASIPPKHKSYQSLDSRLLPTVGAVVKACSSPDESPEQVALCNSAVSSLIRRIQSVQEGQTPTKRLASGTHYP
jgi:hypothetical protein